MQETPVFTRLKNCTFLLIILSPRVTIAVPKFSDFFKVLYL